MPWPETRCSTFEPRVDGLNNVFAFGALGVILGCFEEEWERQGVMGRLWRAPVDGLLVMDVAPEVVARLSELRENELDSISTALVDKCGTDPAATRADLLRLVDSAVAVSSLEGGRILAVDLE